MRWWRNISACFLNSVSLSLSVCCSSSKTVWVGLWFAPPCRHTRRLSAAWGAWNGITAADGAKSLVDWLSSHVFQARFPQTCAYVQLSTQTHNCSFVCVLSSSVLLPSERQTLTLFLNLFLLPQIRFLLTLNIHFFKNMCSVGIQCASAGCKALLGSPCRAG